MKSLSRNKNLPFPKDDIIALEAIRRFIESNLQIKYRLHYFYQEFIRVHKNNFVTIWFMKFRFKDFYGINIMQYLNECRMNKGAKLLLQKRNAPIKEIAHEVGLSNNFWGNFKKYFGLTPTQYRQNNKPIYTPKEIILIRKIKNYNKEIIQLITKKDHVLPVYIRVKKLLPDSLRRLLNYLNQYKEK